MPEKETEQYLSQVPVDSTCFCGQTRRTRLSIESLALGIWRVLASLVLPVPTAVPSSRGLRETCALIFSMLCGGGCWGDLKKDFVNRGQDSGPVYPANNFGQF